MRFSVEPSSSCRLSMFSLARSCGIASVGAGGDIGARGHRLLARLDDRVDDATFMRHVTLYALDEVGYEVVTTAQLHIDLRPGIANPVSMCDQPVVDRDRVERTGNDDQNNDPAAQCDGSREMIAPATLGAGLARDKRKAHGPGCHRHAVLVRDSIGAICNRDHARSFWNS